MGAPSDPAAIPGRFVVAQRRRSAGVEPHVSRGMSGNTTAIWQPATGPALRVFTPEVAVTNVAPAHLGGAIAGLGLIQRSLAPAAAAGARPMWATNQDRSCVRIPARAHWSWCVPAHKRTVQGINDCRINTRHPVQEALAVHRDHNRKVASGIDEDRGAEVEDCRNACAGVLAQNVVVREIAMDQDRLVRQIKSSIEHECKVVNDPLALVTPRADGPARVDRLT